MAILNTLIVNGSSRYLQKAYFQDLQVSGTASLASLSLSGNLSVGGTTTLKTTTIAATLTVSNSIVGQNGLELYHSTPFIDFHYKNNSADYTSRIIEEASGTLSVKNNLSVANKLSSPEIVATNISTTNIRWVKAEEITVADLGGTFIVAPTIYFTSGGTSVYISAISGNTVTMSITDNAITTAELGGHTWKQYSKVKLSGAIGGCVLGSSDGYLSAQLNTTSHVANVVATIANASQLTVGATYSGSNVQNLAMMMYAVGNGSQTNTFKVGMILTSYGDNYRSYLDIYSGGSNASVTRLGNLGGLTFNGTALANQWGLLTTNGYFSGTINATAGFFGGTNGTDGWKISTGKIQSTYTYSNATKYMGIGTNGHSWAFYSGATSDGGGDGVFRVGHAGEMYATNAHITGEVTATSGTIGGCSITNGVLQVANANITALDAAKITSGTIAAARIGANSITADKIAANAIIVGTRNLLCFTGTPVEATINTTNFQTFHTYYTPEHVVISDLGAAVGDSLTISFDWETSSQTTYGTFRLEFYGYKSSSETDSYLTIATDVITMSANAKSGHFSKTWVLDATKINTKRIVARVDASNLKIKISHLMMSLSNREVDWTLSPYESGGFNATANKLYSGTIGSDNSVYISTANMTANIAGRGSTTDWRFTVGSHFGVTNTGAVYATSGTIAGWMIASNSFTSGTWGEDNSVMLCIGTSGSKSIGGSDSISGWVISAGSTFGVTKAGDLYASQATVSGKITATELYLGLTRGALTASVGNLKSSTGVLYGITSSSGNYLYYDGDIISINTKNFKIDGEGNVSMFGVINASGGTVGGLTVSADSLYMADTGMSSNGSKYAFWAGETNGENGAVNSNAAFKVGHNGGLIASNANISGTISATGGVIGGWSISSSAIRKDYTYDGKTGYTTIYSAPYTPGNTVPWNPMFGVYYDGAWRFYARSNGEVYTSNLRAVGGTISGFTINSTGLIARGASAYGTSSFRIITDPEGQCIEMTYPSNGYTYSVYQTSVGLSYNYVTNSSSSETYLDAEGIRTEGSLVSRNDTYGNATLKTGYDCGVVTTNSSSKQIGFMLNQNNNAGIYDYSHSRWALSYNTESKAMTSASSITVSSDERIKTIHKQLNDDHKKLFMALKPIEFSFIDSPEERHFGLGAQTTERSMNELGFGSEYSLVNHISCYGEDAYGRDEAYYMNYTEALMLAVPVVQSHEEEIAELKAKINELETKLSQLTQ